MWNINELVGIISGINCDEGINYLAILRLQDWVEKNKYLVQNRKDASIISSVDHIIESSIITEEEQAKILQLCHAYTQQYDINIVNIYRLCSITDGIICDDVINKAEISRLLNCLSENSKVFIKYKHAHQIVDIVKRIATESEISDAVKEQFIKLLRKEVNELRMEVKLNELYNKIDSQKNIGVDLIDILDNEYIVRKIHFSSERILEKALNSYTGILAPRSEIVFVSLVIIGMLNYDGNFYEYVRRTYPKLYVEYPRQKVDALIRSIASKYREAMNSKTGGFRAIDVILENAIVPSPFMESFFEFIFDIYRINFDFSLPPDLYKEFDFIYTGLSSKLLSDEDDIEVSVTRKTYKLIASTKKLMIDPDGKEALINLSIIIVRIIDTYLNSNKISVSNSYLKEGLEEWANKFPVDALLNGKRKQSKLRSAWEPKFVLCDNNIYLSPPLHRISSNHDFRNIRIVVKNGEETIFNDCKPDIREVIGGYQVAENGILLRCPLGEISYAIMDIDTPIYTSKTTLFRRNIVFDEDGIELKNNRDYSGTAVFCTKSPVQNSTLYKTDADYILSSAVIRTGDSFDLNGDIFSFASFTKPDVLGNMYENSYLLLKESNKQIPVFKDIPSLKFECNNSIRGIIVNINGNFFDINAFRTETTKRNDSIIYTVKLNSLASGIYTVLVSGINNGVRKPIVYKQFVVDRSLKAETIDSSDDSFSVLLTSDILETPIEKTIEVSNFREDCLSFSYKGTYYAFIVPLDFILYRLDEGKWKMPSSEIWIGDIGPNSTIEIYGTKIESVLFVMDGHRLHDTPKLRTSVMSVKIHLGFLLSYKANCDSIAIFPLCKGKAITEIVCYCRCVMDERNTKIYFDEDKDSLIVIPVYSGEGQVYMTVANISGDQVFSSPFVKSGDTIRVEQILPFEDYKVKFIEKKRGLALQKQRVMLSKEVNFHTAPGAVGRSFKIKKAYYDQYVQSKLHRRMHKLAKTYLFISRYVGADQFEGIIFTKSPQGNCPLENINPVEVVIASEEKNNSVDLYITKNGDGLYLDFQQDSIIDTAFDDSAIDILYYEVATRGEKNEHAKLDRTI